MKPTIVFPIERTTGFHACNPNGSFSGIVKEWNHLGLINLEFSNNPFIWWKAIGEILLYHRPTLEWLTEDVEYKAALFGNPDPPLNGKRNSHWIMWPRWITVIEAYRGVRPLPWRKRDFNCVFIGGYENATQRGFRAFEYWKPVCDLFDVFRSRKSNCEKYSRTEYVRLLRRARFGLCLRGYGQKCHREVECMGLGVVPIITPGVSMKYHDSPILGTHYLIAGTPEEVRHLVETIPEDQWMEMSRACMEWYGRNISPYGSFSTTKSICESLLSY